MKIDFNKLEKPENNKFLIDHSVKSSYGEAFYIDGVARRLNYAFLKRYAVRSCAVSFRFYHRDLYNLNPLDVTLEVWDSKWTLKFNQELII